MLGRNILKSIIVLSLVVASQFLIAQFSQASAAEYYVAGDTGLDTNTGTSVQPWKTIQKAANVMVAGDIVNVKGGIVYSDSSCTYAIVCPTNAGTAGNLITYRAWAGTGRPVIDGLGLTDGIVTFRAFLRISGFEIRNAKTYGIQGNLTNSYVINNVIHSNGFVGLAALVSSDYGYVFNNTFFNNDFVGCMIQGGANLVVRNNIIVGSDIGLANNSNTQILIHDNNLYFNNSGIDGYPEYGTDYMTGNGVTAGPNDVHADPLFIDPANGDFRLQTNSPAINAGANLTANGVTTDILGRARPNAGAYDIGAYEDPNLYVDGLDGDDSNNGSRTQPFFNIQKAASVVFPGAIVNVKGGIVYYENTGVHTYPGQVLNTVSGTANDYITFQPWEGTGQPIIDAGHTNRAFNMSYRSYIHLKGFELRNTIDSPVDVRGTTGIIVEGNYIHDSDNYGINGSQALSKLKVINNTIESSEYQSIYVIGNDIEIANNTINLNVEYGSGITLYNSSNALVTQNSINMIPQSVIMGIYVNTSSTIKVNNNILRVIGDEKGSAFGLWIRNSLSGNEILHNTLYGCDISVLVSGTVDSSLEITNNIFGFTNNGIESSKIFNHSNNIYQTTDVSNACTGGITCDASEIISDPHFLDPANGDFRLQPSSPAINAGLDASSYGVTTDIIGVPRPQGPVYDIGAFEFYSIPVTITSPSSNYMTTTSVAFSGFASTTSTATVTNVEYSLDNGAWANATGNFSFAFNDLAQGSHTVKVRATDSYGNQTHESEYATKTFTVDSITPTILLTKLGKITDLPNKVDLTYYFTSQTPKIEGVTEANAIVSFKVGVNTYTTTANNDGSFVITLDNPKLVRGENVITYFSTDVAGNISETRTLKLVVGEEYFPAWIYEKVVIEGQDIEEVDQDGEPTDKPALPAETYKILFKDKDGNPISDTKVEIDGKFYTTDADGFIYVTNIEASNIPYEVNKVTGEFTFNPEMEVNEVVIELPTNQEETRNEHEGFNWWLLFVPMTLFLIGGVWYSYRRNKS